MNPLLRHKFESLLIDEITMLYTSNSTFDSISCSLGCEAVGCDECAALDLVLALVPPQSSESRIPLHPSSLLIPHSLSYLITSRT
jgi:hypothetical protein